MIFLPRKLATCSALTEKIACQEEFESDLRIASERDTRSVEYSTCIRLQ